MHEDVTLINFRYGVLIGSKRVFLFTKLNRNTGITYPGIRSIWGINTVNKLE